MISYFVKQFHTNKGVQIYQAPGRINIIGEHVDYLGGVVLPAAIDCYIQIAIRPNNDQTYRLYSVNYNELYETKDISKTNSSLWANYVLGVVDELIKRGYSIPGFDLAIGGDIPQGSGLSSSAAIEVAVCYGLNDIFNLELDLTEVALISQKAENEFVGTKCGIMDQFIIAHGKKNQCIELNTANLDYRYHIFDLKNYEFTLVQSNVKHTLNESQYNARRRECESALTKIQEYQKLNDLTPIINLYDLDRRTKIANIILTSEEKLRIEHVLSEKERTSQVINSLVAGDFQLVGEALTECHWSLYNNFQVSCPETDFIVEFLNENGSLGSRMIGGGFGGCILALTPTGFVKSIIEELNKHYTNKFNNRVEILNIKISDGVNRIL